MVDRLGIARRRLLAWCVRPGRRLWVYWIQWWWADALIAAALSLALRAGARPGTGVDLVGQLGLAGRQAAYSNMMQLTVIFAGFSGVGFAIYLGLGSRAVRQIKTAAGAPLLRIWIAALVTPWVCALVLVFCGITDRGPAGDRNDTRWVAIAALIVVFLQMVKVVWIFYQLAVTELESVKPTKQVSDDEVHVIGYRAS